VEEQKQRLRESIYRAYHKLEIKEYQEQVERAKANHESTHKLTLKPPDEFKLRAKVKSLVEQINLNQPTLPEKQHILEGWFKMKAAETFGIVTRTNLAKLLIQKDIARDIE
jgi:hypothetical protein